MPARTQPANFHQARSAYFNALRSGKTQSAALALHQAIRRGTAAEVNAFVLQIQQDMGKQDLGLLPETSWRMDGKDTFGHWDNRPERMAERATVPTTEDLRTLLDSESVTDWRIDWPSIVSHWGVSIFWTDGGNEYRAFSKDYAATETSQSM